MSDKKFNFWQKWLTYSNVIVVIIGLLVAFAGNSFLFDLHNAKTVEIYFPEKGLNPETLAFKNWMFGIIGGTIVGFHILMIFISEFAFKKKEKWAYFAMWIGMISWFCIDSSLSLHYGAIHNVYLINLPGFVMVCLPLIFTRKAF